ncbi:MAG TPA: hypothetical protein DC049_02725 [Spirochaetia bacterium]|nr:hypothetical protein [Spirochaetia bacterium]
MNKKYLIPLFLILVIYTGIIFPAENPAQYSQENTWHLFGPVPPSENQIPKEELQKLQTIPSELIINNRQYKGIIITADDHILDFWKIFYQAQNKNPGSAYQVSSMVYCFKEFICTGGGILYTGAGADWWMEWYLDGEPVFDTLKKGNGKGEYSITDHVFAVTLKPGKHVLGVMVRGGSAGWKLAASSDISDQKSLGSAFSIYEDAKNAQAFIILKPDHTDAIYTKGDKIVFNIFATNKGKAFSGDIDILVTREDPSYVITNLGLKMQNGFASHVCPADMAGFIRCTAAAKISGISIGKATATAGVDPGQIQPTQTLPEDFLDFWQEEIAKMRKLKIDMRVEAEGDTGPEAKNEYISFQNINNTRFYGALSCPVKPGKYEVILQVPGAGVRPYKPANNPSAIVLSVGIHGIPVNRENEYYQKLALTTLNGYPHFGKTNRNDFYYRRVILGCIRALDILTAMPNADTNKISVRGGSQGGALSLILGGLDRRITSIQASVPALCDHTGGFNGRCAGWPRLLSQITNISEMEKIRETSRYYDAVNFTRFINVPIAVGVGFNDTTCPPSSVFSAYAAIPSKKKALVIIPEATHSFEGGSLKMSGEMTRLLAK